MLDSLDDNELEEMDESELELIELDDRDDEEELTEEMDDEELDAELDDELDNEELDDELGEQQQTNLRLMRREPVSLQIRFRSLYTNLGHLFFDRS